MEADVCNGMLNERGDKEGEIEAMKKKLAEIAIKGELSYASGYQTLIRNGGFLKEKAYIL